MDHHPPLPDFRHPGERPVGRYDGQGETAAVVTAYGGGLPGHALRQLHHQLEGWQALQCYHTQTQVRQLRTHTHTNTHYAHTLPGETSHMHMRDWNLFLPQIYHTHKWKIYHTHKWSMPPHIHGLSTVNDYNPQILYLTHTSKPEDSTPILPRFYLDLSSDSESLVLI